MASFNQAEFSPDGLLAAWAVSPAPRERASAFVISTVIAYPRRASVPRIIADLLLLELQQAEGARYDICLADVVALAPDPALTAQIINAEHRKHGVGLRLPPHVAANFVGRCANMSLEVIRGTTVLYAEDAGIALPAGLEDPIFVDNHCTEDTVYPSRVPVLEEFLLRDEDMLCEIATGVEALAEQARFGSRAHGLEM